MWYKLPEIFTGASCDAAGDLTITTSMKKYSNLLQELTFIRPARMLSPKSFKSQAADGWKTHNSCPTGWNDADGEIKGTSVNIKCAGIGDPVGTGPFKFTSRTEHSDSNSTAGNYIDGEVVFSRHETYWGGKPDIEVLKLKYFETAAEVATALSSGTIDAVIGDGVLAPSDLLNFQASSLFKTYMTPIIMHDVIIINSGKTPTDDINVRKAIMHSVNKADIIKQEFNGIGKAVDRLFPTAAPYSDVELTPRWDYDLEKAKLLNCAPAITAASLPTPFAFPDINLCPDPVTDDATLPVDSITTANLESSSSVLALAACAFVGFF